MIRNASMLWRSEASNELVYVVPLNRSILVWLKSGSKNCAANPSEPNHLEKKRRRGNRAESNSAMPASQIKPVLSA